MHVRSSPFPEAECLPLLRKLVVCLCGPSCAPTSARTAGCQCAPGGIHCERRIGRGRPDAAAGSGPESGRGRRAALRSLRLRLMRQHQPEQRAVPPVRWCVCPAGAPTRRPGSPGPETSQESLGQSGWQLRRRRRRQLAEARRGAITLLAHRQFYAELAAPLERFWRVRPVKKAPPRRGKAPGLEACQWRLRAAPRKAPYH
jgi:hypothetical protein